MKQAYIVDAIRTPIGKFRGSLSTVRTDDLAALPIKELLARNPQLDPSVIEDVIIGCANQAGEDNRNVARMALLLAGLPFSVPGETINRLCSSGMSAAIHANQAIKADDGDVFIVGGVENMTRGPWVLSKSAQPFGNDAKLYDSSFGWRFINPKMVELYGTESMGNTAENLAEKFNIGRPEQDWFAWQSQMKATKARDNGRLALEIMPVSIPVRKSDPMIFEHDEFIRSSTTTEILAKLRPAFRPNGTVTAGNASGLNDGAAAMLIASEQGLKDHQLKPIARIVSSAVVGVEPRIMGIGPVYASQKALKKAGLTLADMDIIEINEAFSAQVLAVLRKLNIDKLDPRINPNGGAIALGHPLGMSGTRILQTAAIQLQQTKKRYALVTLCIGVGQGYATVIERV
ncbi:MAG TPA: 3-oxoadipyl-CoA thiolase [Saprospiraceae bacterium]|nr:3-oxoadipyl-CoA thiolase [Saprospiraceae bacterium]